MIFGIFFILNFLDIALMFYLLDIFLEADFFNKSKRTFFVLVTVNGIAWTLMAVPVLYPFFELFVIIKNALYFGAILFVSKPKYLIGFSTMSFFFILTLPLQIPNLFLVKSVFNNDYQNVVYQIFPAISDIITYSLFWSFYVKILSMKMKYALKNAIYKCRFILVIINVLLPLIEIIFFLLDFIEKEGILKYEIFEIQIFLIVLFVIIFYLSRKNQSIKKELMSAYEKSKRQYEKVCQSYDDFLYFRHDYINIMLSLKSAIDQEEIPQILNTIDELKQYTNLEKK